MEALMAWFGDNLLAKPEQPVCSKCGAPMWLIRIEPEKAGCAQRTFECPRCQNRMTEVIDLEKAA
jgi:DNA-directed RNA polymerase subunit RPC12/RpoP